MIDSLLSFAIHKPWTTLGIAALIGGITAAAVADSRDAAKARASRPQLFREVPR